MFKREDPLSPILFNILADILTTLIARAKEDGKVEVLLPHLVEGGVSSLKYADDIIIFTKHNIIER